MEYLSYSVQMRENMDQETSEYEHFLQSVACFHLSNITTKECRIPYDFQNPVTKFEILYFMYVFICLYVILSKTFDTCGRRLTGL